MPATTPLQPVAAAAGALAFALALALAACVPPPAAAPRAGAADVVGSNVTRANYAGSAACAACHPTLHAAWAGSPMRRMTRLASTVPVAAPFDGRELAMKGDSVRLESHDGRRYARVTTRRRGAELWRVTRVIGGRYREDYAGYPVAGVSADSPPLAEERVLPVSWLRFSDSLRYKGYSVMTPERDRFGEGAVWRQSCIYCHNTTPLFTTLYDDLLGPRFADDRRAKYQGAVSDDFLPPDRTFRWKIDDADALRAELDAEAGRLGGAPLEGGSLDEALLATIKITRQKLSGKDLVEIGIGCEACHNGCREHVADPNRKPTFVPTSPFVHVEPPEGRKDAPTKAEWINRTCARCHTVLFSEYEATWEGGRRSASPGGSTINSGEARDYLLGGCATRMSCTACHDPHHEDRPEELARFDTVAGNAACAGCHAAESGAGLPAHTHHGPTSTGSACLSCHMPRKNMGLAYGLTRYHRIGSPDDPARVERDRPLECALCHVDRSVAELVGAMERWWGKRFDRGRIAVLYGSDSSVLPLDATLVRGRPHEQAVAVATLGERGARGALAGLAPLLANDYPLVRGYAKTAMERLAGGPVAIDLDASRDAIAAAAARWLEERAR